MAGPIAVDTPDYQRGIVNAQKQLAFVNQTSDVVTVGVPPNAETLVIATPTNSLSSTPVCLGLTTALNYPAVRVGGFLGALGAIHWMFDISSALDARVQITWPGAAGEQWWVYADAGVRLTVNPTQASSNVGQQYVIPSVPSTLANDHPLNEMRWGTTGVSNGQNVLGPLPATERYRVFTAQIANFSVAAECELLDSTGSWFFQTSSINPGIFGAWPLTGIPLTAGSPIGARVTNGASCAVSLGFTVETL